MPALNLEKKNLPFLLGGDGKLTVDTGELALAAPLPQGTGPIATVSFQASGGKRLELGLEQTVKLGLSAQARVQITPVFPGSSARRKSCWPRTSSLLSSSLLTIAANSFWSSRRAVRLPSPAPARSPTGR